jgi:hypothetical protein
MSAHEQLRSDLMRAVAAGVPAAQRTRLRFGHGGRLLALAAALLVAGGAFALTGGFSRDQITVPTHFGKRQALVIAHSGTNGIPWRLSLRPCGAGLFATGISVGPQGLQRGAAYNGCQRYDARSAVTDANWFWSPGITVVWGLVRTDVASVRLALDRAHNGSRGRTVRRQLGVVTVRTRAAPEDLLGHRIAPMRFFVISRPYRIEYSRIEAIDASGSVVGRCLLRCPVTPATAP